MSNSIILSGKVKFVKHGDKVVSFVLKGYHKEKDYRGDDRITYADVRCVLFGYTKDMAKGLQDDQQVLVTGKLSNNKYYSEKEGKDVYSIQLICETLGIIQQQQHQHQQQPQQQQTQADIDTNSSGATGIQPNDDDIPFSPMELF
jgi:single-stranded DNA-binding protein